MSALVSKGVLRARVGECNHRSGARLRILDGAWIYDEFESDTGTGCEMLSNTHAAAGIWLSKPRASSWESGVYVTGRDRVQVQKQAGVPVRGKALQRPEVPGGHVG